MTYHQTLEEIKREMRQGKWDGWLAEQRSMWTPAKSASLLGPFLGLLAWLALAAVLLAPFIGHRVD